MKLETLYGAGSFLHLIEDYNGVLEYWLGFDVYLDCMS